MPPVVSKEDGTAIWPWSKQQIKIGDGLEYVPNKYRKKNWKGIGNVVL